MVLILTLGREEFRFSKKGIKWEKEGHFIILKGASPRDCITLMNLCSYEYITEIIGDIRRTGQKHKSSRKLYLSQRLWSDKNIRKEKDIINLLRKANPPTYFYEVRNQICNLILLIYYE